MLQFFSVGSFAYFILFYLRDKYIYINVGIKAVHVNKLKAFQGDQTCLQSNSSDFVSIIDLLFT